VDSRDGSDLEIQSSDAQTHAHEPFEFDGRLLIERDDLPLRKEFDQPGELIIPGDLFLRVFCCVNLGQPPAHLLFGGNDRGSKGRII